MRPTEPLQAAASRLVRHLKAHGHEAYWAGGCVRDMLLGRPPSDIDIATGALPDQIVSIFPRTRKVGVQFGVVLVRQGAFWLEVATFRQDVNYEDGRRPERVVFTSAQEDAKRRDFTINGLFYDPAAEQIIDYVGGRADLEARIIRAIGNPAERFAEDHLRMLRAARFAARFGFHIEPTTADAIRQHASRLIRISPERIREELEKMLVPPSRSRAVELMADLGLMPYLWPGAVSSTTVSRVRGERAGTVRGETAGTEAGRYRAVQSSPAGDGADADWPAERVQRCTAVMAHLTEPVDFVLAMAALLHDRPPPKVEAISRALRCSNREIDDMVWLTGNQERIGETQRLSLAEFKTLAAHARFESLLVLHRAVCEATDRPLEGYDDAVRLWAEIPPDQIAPPPLVTGDDLISLGLEPGPTFKSLLDTLYTAQLNNQVANRNEALARLRSLLAH